MSRVFFCVLVYFSQHPSFPEFVRACAQAKSDEIVQEFEADRLTFSPSHHSYPPYLDKSYPPY